MFGFLEQFLLDGTCCRWLATDHHLKRPTNNIAILGQRLRIFGRQCINLLLAGSIERLKGADFRFGATGRLGMPLSPNGHFFAAEWFVLLLNDLRQTEMKMLVKKGIHHRPAECIVVVFEIKMFSTDVLHRTEKRVELLQLRQSIRLQILRPVVGRSEPQRPGRRQRGKFDIPGADPQVTGIFTRAAPLHRCRCHHGRKRRRYPIVDCGEYEGLGTASAGAGDSNAAWIDLGKTTQPIEGLE